MTQSSLSRTVLTLTLACSAGASGCFKISDVLDSGHSAQGHDAGDPGSSHSSGPDGGRAALPDAGVGTELPLDRRACMRGGLCTVVDVTVIDKVDLLFVIDDSSTMAQEQQLLRAQLPHLLERLTTGDRDGDGVAERAVARDLHLGVVSSDLGLPGISDVQRCAGLGDDGILQDRPRLPGCSESYPRFLSYIPVVTTQAQAAGDLACIAMLGGDGCGVTQPLESGLKALWPAADTRVTFLADVNGLGTKGHGDDENDGFLRNDPLQGISLIALVVLTDNDDCSTKDTSHLVPSASLDPNEPADARLLGQGMNVRCAFNPDNLFATQRYLNALRALRSEREDLVVFAAITGVPPQTVGADVLDSTDFTDAASRAVFYQRIEGDPAMQPVVDDHGTADVADDTMRPACRSAHGDASPARRIVDVAKRFGENGLVQSICEDDYRPAIDAIADRISAKLGGPCLQAMLTRTPEHKVACDVIWELPPPAQAHAGVPTACEQSGYEFLLPLPKGALHTTPDGGARCKLPQLAVEQTTTGGQPIAVPTESGGKRWSDGWYYDDFSPEVEHECRKAPRARIAFTPNAHPPTGVRVVLDCDGATN